MDNLLVLKLQYLNEEQIILKQAPDMGYFSSDICKRKNMLMSEERKLEWVLAT